ncbi:MAG: SDR family NAD(P)-dependent oxidoreductase [Moorea sp. SIO1F2]|nr:SDR family NAD(P)-dependent oxidoreductase [Moorena sp. SIO1F2]NET83867.1 SDR family NAD(P)-dependent oxidoreductase [Moorena sp. SIO1F2]
MNLKNQVKDLPKTALITGASSGIGYEFTKLFARDGYKLVLVARSESKLSQLAEDFR